MALFQPLLPVIGVGFFVGSCDQLRHLPKQLGGAPLGNSFQWSHLGSSLDCVMFLG